MKNQRNIELTTEELLDCTSEALYALFGVDNTDSMVDISITEQQDIAATLFDGVDLTDTDAYVGDVWAVSANTPTQISFRK